MRAKLRSPYFWFVTLAILAFAALLITSRQLLYETWIVLQSANLALIILLPLIQITNYLFIGGYYRTMFGFFETKISWARAWGVVASLNFVNQILPSGGLSGITYLAYGFRTNLSIGKTTMIQTGRYLFSLSAYFVIAPIAMILLLNEGSNGSIGDLIMRAIERPAALATMIAFSGLVVLFISLVNSNDFAQKLGEYLRRVINVLGRVFRKPQLLTHKTTKKLIEDFHDGVDFFKAQKSQILKPLGFMVLSVSMELSIVYTSMMAVGADVSFAVVFISFLSANVVGVISIIPGDVGVHEAVMTTMLVAFGVAAPVALSAVLLYRVFNKVAFLPIGFYFYTQLLKPAKVAKN